MQTMWHLWVPLEGCCWLLNSGCEPLRTLWHRVCQSVAANLEGQALASFTGVSSAVKSAVEAALHRILTPRRSIDVLRDIQVCLLWLLDSVGRV